MPVLQELNAVVERASCPFQAKATGFSARSTFLSLALRALRLTRSSFNRRTIYDIPR